MPQMAPMMWLILFIMFSLIFIIFNILNYYNFLKFNSKISMNLEKTLNTNSKTLNWKW